MTTELPATVADAETTRRTLDALFGRRWSARRLDALVTSSRVARRHLLWPPDRLLDERSLAGRGVAYREAMIELGRRALGACMTLAGRTPELLVTTSCTGFMIPSVDAYLVEALALPITTRRLPITELGCSAGAGGLRMAAEFVAAGSGRSAATLAIELPSLTLRPDDDDFANVAACALFGDGAAAVLVDDGPGPGLRVLDAVTALVPGTQDVMGFHLTDTGFAIDLSAQLPRVLRESLRPVVGAMLARRGLEMADMGFVVAHCGGPRILEAMQDALDLHDGQLATAWETLAAVGNLSSASVLFVLRRLLDAPPARGTPGLLLAAGPGITVEALLLQG